MEASDPEVDPHSAMERPVREVIAELAARQDAMLAVLISLADALGNYAPEALAAALALRKPGADQPPALRDLGYDV